MTPTEDVDVAIVGAGIGGLRTADRLRAAGLRVVVLESRDRVGGRLWSHPTADGPLDLGATWFWAGERRVAALIAELGVPTHEQHLAGDAMYQGGPQAQRIQGNPIDVPSGRFTSGATSLTDALATRLRDVVELSTVVHAVDQSPERLVVHHTRGQVRASHVVLAVPPALAVHRIEFRPGLPPEVVRLAEHTPVWMGNIVKVVVAYPEPFWRGQGLAGAAMSHVGPMRELHDMCGPDGRPAALFGFVPLRAGDPAPTEDQVLAQLVTLFGPAAAAPSEVVIADWHDDPHTAVPHDVAGSPADTYGHPMYQQPLMEGRLHWASTETGTSSTGHIEGALAAAERAVGAVLRTTDRDKEH